MSSHARDIEEKPRRMRVVYPLPLVETGNPEGTYRLMLDWCHTATMKTWGREALAALRRQTRMYRVIYGERAERWWREWHLAHPGARLTLTNPEVLSPRRRPGRAM